MPSPATAFKKLFQQAAACTICPCMAQQSAVLGPKNGNPNADILFVAEAPGRFGGARTGVPFSGDKSGDNFEILLAHIGLTRDDVFITNTVLCNPLENGNNRRPTLREIDHCRPFLQTTIELVKPRLVVTLGGVGLEAIGRLYGMRFKLQDAAAKPQRVNGFTLFPLYHPSPRVANWKRPLARQKKDFERILRILKTA